MPPHLDQLEAPLNRLDQMLADFAISSGNKAAVERWRSDAGALRFHLRPTIKGRPILVAVVGGTGTGKSTLVNRLLGVSASATSFRRTFTSGAVAVARSAADIPRGWLAVEHIFAGLDQLPARGQVGKLMVVPIDVLGEKPASHSVLESAVLIDTPDLDGDQPAHHAEADRAFRWAQALLFLVTPEKYQMPEMLPYYRLAARYGVPALFVMNKCEEQAVVEDYRQQLEAAREPGRENAAVRAAGEPADGDAADDNAARLPVYVLARDDAAYEPPASENLASLRWAIARLSSAVSDSSQGLANRAADLAGRLEDQLLSPLRQERREADELIRTLRDMETPIPGVDVNPVTQDLRRRLQQRSVLYLIGPQRVLDRVRQAPALLVRLPRVAWDYVMRGEISAAAFNSASAGNPREVPDFRSLLMDQFAVLQSRLDDLLASSAAARKWMAAGGATFAQARLTPQEAGRIADEEIADLRAWLEKRWNATPRDTRAVQSLLKYLPGGKKLTAATEAAPYLLTVALIAHHALFGTDLLVLGGYTLATWLTEHLSNEVAARTRAANTRISDRFAHLAHEQIEKLCIWLDRQAPPARGALAQLDRSAGELATAAGLEL